MNFRRRLGNIRVLAPGPGMRSGELPGAVQVWIEQGYLDAGAVRDHAICNILLCAAGTIHYSPSMCQDDIFALLPSHFHRAQDATPTLGNNCRQHTLCARFHRPLRRAMQAHTLLLDAIR